MAPGYKSRVVNDAPIPQTFTIGPYESDGFAILIGDEYTGEGSHRCYTGGWTRQDLKDIIEMIQEALNGKFTDSSPAHD